MRFLISRAPASTRPLILDTAPGQGILAELYGPQADTVALIITAALNAQAGTIPVLDPFADPNEKE